MTRDPLRAAAIGILVIVLIVLGALHARSLPFIGDRSATYSADFADAGGLKKGDPVEVSGVRVGSVKGIAIQHTHVVISFGVSDGVRLGRDTRAAVKVSSLLGAKFLDIVPAGPGRLDGAIALSRTTPAYDIVEAFAQLTETTEEIDKKKVAQALDTISTTFRDSPESVRGALRGLEGFSAAIASRDAEIRELLRHARATTRVLAERSSDVHRLIVGSNQILAELDERRQGIRRLLTTTTSLARQLDGLVEENQQTLTPALRQLHTVVATLHARQGELAETLRNLAVFGRVFTTTVGSGPWFDSIIPNIPSMISFGGEK